MGTEAASRFDKLRCALLEGLKIKRRAGRASPVDERQMWSGRVQRYDGLPTGTGHQQHEFLKSLLPQH